MNRTSLLVLILSALLLVHYYPELATLVWSLALSLGLIWLGLSARKYYFYHRQQRAKAALAHADNEEFREYEREVAALRDASPVSGTDLEDELARLQQRHRAMLDRRFGPH